MKALIFLVNGETEQHANNNYFYISARTNVEYAIMIAARVAETGSHIAAATALLNAGVSFTGGLYTFSLSGPFGSPITLALEASAASSLVASGICTIAGLATGIVGDNAEDAFKNDINNPSLNKVFAEVSEKIKYSLRNINYTDEVIKPAEEINEFWRVKGYTNPPYKVDTPVYQIKLVEKTNFVRVYDGVHTGTSGQFLMKLEDISNIDGSLLTASQIKDKFALEYLPQYVADANIPLGTTMNCGIASPIDGWGLGGGLQFDLNGVYTGEFTFRCNLPN